MHRPCTNQPEPASMAQLIGAIGEQNFGHNMLSFLHKTCGVDHCMVFRANDDAFAAVTALSRDGSDLAHQQVDMYVRKQLWRRDPMVTEARDQLTHMQTSLARCDTSVISDRDLSYAVWGRSGVRDRLLICGRWDEGMIGISLLKAQHSGTFCNQSLDTIDALTEVLLATVSRHIGMLSERIDLSTALTSLDMIELTMATIADGLSPRETSVCARILYGMSSIGIALDLGIGEETVMTYRKRAYARLSIGSQRELLLWYLRGWSEQAGVSARIARLH